MSRNISNSGDQTLPMDNHQYYSQFINSFLNGRYDLETYNSESNYKERSDNLSLSVDVLESLYDCDQVDEALFLIAYGSVNINNIESGHIEHLIENGMDDILIKLLELGMDPNYTLDNGLSLLMALLINRSKVVSELLEYELNVNHRDNDGNNFLFYLADFENLVGMENRPITLKLLDLGADITAGNIVLRAASYGLESLALLLKERGAPIDSLTWRIDNDIQICDLGIGWFDLLIKLGLDPSKRDCNGDVGIIEMMREGYFDLAFSFKFDPNIADSEGDTPLYICIQRGEMIDRILAMGATIDSSMLFSFVRDRDIDSIKRMIAIGADPLVRDSDGKTLLMHSCDRDMIDYLLSLGLNINDVDSNGNTFLHHCCEETRGILEYILELPNLDIHPVNKDKKTALELLLKNYEYLSYAVAGGRKYRKEIDRDSYELIALVEKFIAIGAAIENKDLIIACERLHPTVIEKILLQKPMITEDCYEAAKKNPFQPKRVYDMLRAASKKI